MDIRGLNAVIAAFLTALVGTFPYLRRRDKITWYFAVSNLALSVWDLGDTIELVSASHAAKVFIYRSTFVGGIFVVWYFYKFILALLQIDNQYKKVWKVLLILGIVQLPLTLTPYFIRDVDTSTSPFKEIPGEAFSLFVVFLAGGLGFPLYKLFKTYRNTPVGHERTKLKYMLFALTVAFFEAVYYLVGVYKSNISPYYAYFQVVYIAIVAYAILAHQLMDINVVVRKTLLYSFVSAVLAAIYVGTITFLAQVLEGRNGSASVLSSAMAAIFITLLFNPLRIRSQHWIDRFFPRERLDPGLLQEAAGGFAHEMKRPLAKISLPAELALMDIERVKSGELAWIDVIPKLEERLKFIMNQSIDAGFTIEAIRELSASVDLPFSHINVRDVLEQALASERELLDKNNISIVFHVPKNLPMIFGRTRQLEIVFVNLIKNAREAMSTKPFGRPKEIKIESQTEAENVVIRIQDSGPGVGAQDIVKIFQPHYTTKGPYGTGMGLYLSNQIIQAHRGSIAVESQNGLGTIFIVQIPKNNTH